MADDERTPQKPDLREYGVSGTRILAGLVFEETVPALQGMALFRTINAMRTDSTMSALKKSIELPTRSAEWFVEPFSDDPKDIDKADFIHWNLYDFGSQSMDDAVRLALLSLDYGFTPLEICYQYIDSGSYQGKVGWSKLAWRNPATRWRWNMGEIDGMQELVSLTQLSPPYYVQTDIPRNKLLLFVNELEGDNFDGRSLYRNAYKNWLFREQLYRIQAIGLERAYMGIPVATLGENYSDELKGLATQIVTNIRTDDNAGVVKPPDDVLALEILHNAINAGTEMQAAINYHSREMLKSTLAHFLDLGSAGASGSWALSSDQSELFLMAINAPANNLEEQFNLEPGIPALIRFNFNDAVPGQMPRLRHGDIGQRSLGQLGRTLMALGQWGFLTPDDATEDWFRRVLGMPERDNTVTAEALATLSQSMFPIGSDIGHSQTGPRALPAQAPGATAAIPATKATPGVGVPSQVPVALSELVSRMPMQRPQGRLTDTDRLRLRLSEQLVDTLDSLQRGAAGKPERPSQRAARLRRPYALHMAEDSAKATIARVNAQARAGTLTPVAKAPERKTVPRHRLVAKQQGRDIEQFFRRLKS